MPRTKSAAVELTAATRLVAVGSVDHRSARIWVRSDAAGSHTLEIMHPDGQIEARAFDMPADPELDGTTAVTWPDDVGAIDLAPHQTYTFSVRRGDEGIGAGRFTTAPVGVDDSPDTFSIAVASCHQPFADDGSVNHAAMGLLNGLEERFDAEGVEQVLFLGDQMYTDLPKGASLFGERQRETLAATRPEVRRLLQQRYRAFWRVRPFQRIQSRFATIAILDDHEVVDNFGSHPAHARPEWAAYREGALDAFADYEALRSHPRLDPRPPSWPTRFARGPVAGLVLDDRSERVAGRQARVLGPDQWEALDRFLVEEIARPILMIGLGVPLVHEPEWLVDPAIALTPAGSAADDRWCATRADHDRLLGLLHARRRLHPEQRVVLVSGDVHVGTVIELRFDDAPPVLQLVSSGITNVEARAIRLANAALPLVPASVATADGAIRGSGHLLAGQGGAGQNPYTDLNAGLVTVRREGHAWGVRLRLLGAGERGVEVVFDSGWL